MTETTSRFEELKIPLADRVHDLDSVTGIVGIPEWWPTGSRVAVVLAQASTAADPLIEAVQAALTERKYLTLRFPMPFMQAGKKKPDDMRVLQRTFESAVAMLSQDPSAAPAHVFIGGKDVGAMVAAHTATTRMRIEGLFFLGFPLHKQDSTDDLRTDRLYRVTSPMLFVQGDRDRHCDLGILRTTLGRVGAPVQLHVVKDADHTLRVPKKSERSAEQVQAEILAVLEAWIRTTLEGP